MRISHYSNSQLRYFENLSCNTRVWIIQNVFISGCFSCFSGAYKYDFYLSFFPHEIISHFIIFLLSSRFACGDNKQVLQGERLARLTSLKKEHEEYERKRREREKDSNQPRQPTKRFTGVCHNCGKTGHRQSACKEAKKKE